MATKFMERGPEFRIVGDAKTNDRENLGGKFYSYLFEKHLDSLSLDKRVELEEGEYKKTPEEKLVIDFANQKTNELMEKAGVKPFTVPERNLHFVPENLFFSIIPKGSQADAMTFPQHQAVILKADTLRTQPLHSACVVFHELMHMKGHHSFELENVDGKHQTSTFRSGISVHAAQKEVREGRGHKHFSGLDEAVVAEHEKRFFQDLLEHPLFKEQKKWLTSDEVMEKRKQVADKYNTTIDEVYWENADSKYSTSFAYPFQRNVLRYVTSEIQHQFHDDYNSADDVLTEFLKANVTGQLLKIAHLVEGTFGEGAFRELGSMDVNNESGIRMIESMRAARYRFEQKGINEVG